MRVARLTTVNNPFDPFDQYEEWLSFDRHLGYDTEGMVARFTISSDELSIADQMAASEMAIDELVLYNVTGVYRKVVRDFPDPEY